MKKHPALILAAALLLSIFIGAPASASKKANKPLNFDVSKLAPYLDTNPSPTPKLTKTPKPSPTPKPASVSKSTVFKTVTVPSVENYISNVEPCYQMTMEDNYYVMSYRNCGKSETSLASNLIWLRIKLYYTSHLKSTGLFKELSHEENGTYERVALSYAGPGKLPRPFSTNGGAKQEAVTVISRDGNVQVYYSRDIRTSDLDETMKRLHVSDKSSSSSKSSSSKKSNSSKKSSGKSCSICDGDGKCNKCGGDGWRYRTVLRNGKHDTVNSRCNGSACLYGRCTACGGDGRIK